MSRPADNWPSADSSHDNVQCCPSAWFRSHDPNFFIKLVIMNVSIVLSYPAKQDHHQSWEKSETQSESHLEREHLVPVCVCILGLLNILTSIFAYNYVRATLVLLLRLLFLGCFFLSFVCWAHRTARCK